MARDHNRRCPQRGYIYIGQPNSHKPNTEKSLLMPLLSTVINNYAMKMSLLILKITEPKTIVPTIISGLPCQTSIN
jgi:hypothetical protein